MRLAFRCVVRNGIRRFQFADPANDPPRCAALARDGARGGRRGDRRRADLLDQPRPHARVLRRARRRARRLRRASTASISRIPGGLLTTDAVRELAPHFVRAAGARPLELHSHCTIGLAPLRLHGGRAAPASTCCTPPRAGSRAEPRSRRLVDGSQPRGRGIPARTRPRALAHVVRLLRRPRREQGPAAGRPRRSSTPPTTATSCPAGW